MELKSVLSERIGGLRESLRTVSGLLSEEAVLSAESGLARIEERLAQCSGPLHVGLLGGTGVGKSTIINALAGAEISSASDRRPHTDRIVVYRHKDQPLVESLSDLVLQPHRTHENETIRNLVLYDLPDFDSVLPENRMRVLRFLESLDVVCWVASPEKYADQALYDVLRISPQNPGNFTFILNKIDRIVDGAGRFDAGQTEGVVRDFKEKLEAHGVSEPHVYALSALEAVRGGADTGDFERFRNVLFQKRREKEIRTIKLANLEYELHTLVQRMSDYPDTEGLIRSLDDLNRYVEEEFQPLAPRIRMMAQDRPDDAMRLSLRSIWLAAANAKGWVLGVVRGMLSVQRLFSSARGRALEDLLQVDPTLVRVIVRKIHTIHNHVIASLARFPMAERAWTARLDPDRLPERIRELRDECSADARILLEEADSSGFAARLRRLKYRLIVAAPAVIVTVHLMDPDAVFLFFTQPKPDLFYRMCLNFLAALFQTKGLVALVSFLLIEGALSVVLSFGALRRVDREIDRFYSGVCRRFESRVAALVREYQEDVEAGLGSLLVAAKELERLETWVTTDDRG